MKAKIVNGLNSIGKPSNTEQEKFDETERQRLEIRKVTNASIPIRTIDEQIVDLILRTNRYDSVFDRKLAKLESQQKGAVENE